MFFSSLGLVTRTPWTSGYRVWVFCVPMKSIKNAAIELASLFAFLSLSFSFSIFPACCLQHPLIESYLKLFWDPMLALKAVLLPLEPTFTALRPFQVAMFIITILISSLLSQRKNVVQFGMLSKRMKAVNFVVIPRLSLMGARTFFQLRHWSLVKTKPSSSKQVFLMWYI